MGKALLHGVTLANAKNKIVNGEELGQDKNLLAIYFAADWCPDCRAFQPTLNRFYESTGGKLDIVFVGSDASAEDQFTHFTEKQGSWWMASFEGEIRTQLKRKFGICASAEVDDLYPITRQGGIPTLLIIRCDGEILDADGINSIKRDGFEALTKWQQL
ncbi:hypothetical protein CCR75_007887 [Bremia lactucae]|uniref:Thioredoxin domain-containing protein n=1 Tax=Bremia lactucae TaxID=4779 RepID=A0A976FM83_BRELC|nr:hypothetical protein CCR75_007887 [Bremia lactucae]